MEPKNLLTEKKITKIRQTAQNSYLISTEYKNVGILVTNYIATQREIDES